MAAPGSGTWTVAFQDGDRPLIHIDFDMPAVTSDNPETVTTSFSQAYRTSSRAIAIGGDKSAPRFIHITGGAIKGSVIMTVSTSERSVINQFAIEGTDVKFVLAPPRSNNIVLTFRFIGEVTLSSLCLNIEEASVQPAVEWMLEQYEDAAKRRRKGYLEYYVDFLLESGCDLRAPGFIEYLFGLGKYQEIIDIVGDDCWSKEIWGFRNRAKMCMVIDRPEMIRDMLVKRGIREYRVALINSGFGDILTNGNLSGFVCERFGLNFSGMCRSFEGRFDREYYEDVFGEVPIPSPNDRTLFIEIENFADDIDDIIKTMEMTTSGQYDRLCLMPLTPNSFSRTMRHSKTVCRNFLDNQFNRYIKEKYPLPHDHHPGTTVLIHIRLGDVAPIPVGRSLLNLFELKRGNIEEAIVDVDSGSRSQTMRSMVNLQHLSDFILQLKEINSSIRVVLISDGLDMARIMLFDETVVERIPEFFPGLSTGSIKDSISGLEKMIRSMPADEMQIGEGTMDDYFRSASLIVSSDIIISTARSFTFNCLASFKSGTVLQHFFSPVMGGITESLETKGCIVHRFTEFTGVRDEVIKCLTVKDRPNNDSN